MKILIDMNLSPAWVSVLEEAGHTASHWKQKGLCGVRLAKLQFIV
jgi:predicted nuclease of predicted toxin-antitoxin system